MHESVEDSTDLLTPSTHHRLFLICHLWSWCQFKSVSALRIKIQAESPNICLKRPQNRCCSPRGNRPVSAVLRGNRLRALCVRTRGTLGRTGRGPHSLHQLPHNLNSREAVRNRLCSDDGDSEVHIPGTWYF